MFKPVKGIWVKVNSSLALDIGSSTRRMNIDAFCLFFNFIMHPTSFVQMRTQYEGHAKSSLLTVHGKVGRRHMEDAVDEIFLTDNHVDIVDMMKYVFETTRQY